MTSQENNQQSPLGATDPSSVARVQQGQEPAAGDAATPTTSTTTVPNNNDHANNDNGADLDVDEEEAFRKGNVKRMSLRLAGMQLRERGGGEEGEEDRVEAGGVQGEGGGKAQAEVDDDDDDDDEDYDDEDYDEDEDEDWEDSDDDSEDPYEYDTPDEDASEPESDDDDEEEDDEEEDEVPQLSKAVEQVSLNDTDTTTSPSRPSGSAPRESSTVSESRFDEE